MKKFFTTILVLAVVVGGAYLWMSRPTPPVEIAQSTAAPLPPEPRTPPLVFTDFNAGNIISDEVFYDPNTMTDAEIDEFIQTVNDGCRTGDAPCLNEYREDTPDYPADQYCRGLDALSDATAAEIIGQVARSCGVNPQALLVMLQKEQGLLTASGPRLTQDRYSIAMGYGCPDTANCDPQYFGFSNQVYHAARQFQIYLQNPGNFSVVPFSENSIRYHHNSECGETTVYVENFATAGLYNYTPYQPDENAKAGSPAGCSAVGNINFYAYFNAWFGSHHR